MLCFFVSVCFNDARPRLELGMHFVWILWSFQVLPPAISSGFCFSFLASSGASCFLWVGGVPLAAFSLPLPLWLPFLLGWWVPLAAFSRLFPHVSWVGGGVCFCFSCYLLHLASRSLRSRIGQHGLPTRKPPGPPHPVPWRVCPYPSPAGS